MVSANLKQNEVQSTLQLFMRKIQALQEKNFELLKNIDNLEKIFTAAKAGSILKMLEDKLGLVHEAHEQYIEAQSVLSQLSAKFGKNKVASKPIQAIKTLVTNCELAKTKAMQVLNKIAKEQRPVELTSNDELFKSIVVGIMDSIKDPDSKKKTTINPKASTYMVGIGKNEQIRFARYIPLKNAPTIMGETKDLIFVASVMLLGVKQAKGKLKAVKISPLSIGLIASFLEPDKLDSALYQVKSVREAKDILAFLAQRHSLTIFGESIKGTPAQRREKVLEKLKILQNKDIKIEINKNFLIIKVPNNLVQMNDKEPTEWYKQLYMDVQRIAGLPVNTRHTAGRIHQEKLEKKGKYTLFTFRVIPVTPDKFIKEAPMSKDADSVLSDDATEFLRSVRDEAKRWMNVKV
jgi:hypothetical protein